MNKKYYDILGIPEDASQEDIKAAWKAKSFLHHPDRGGDQTAFIEASEAFEVLSGKRPAQPQQGNPFDMDFDFSSFFGGNRYQKKRRPAQEYKEMGINLQVSLQDIVDGKSHEMEITRSKDCTKCAGKGGKKVDSCLRCKGQGFYTVGQRFGNMTIGQQVPCNQCKTRGRVFEEECGDCKGEGYTEFKESFRFSINKED